MFSYVGYNLLVSKVDVIALDMEWAAGEILAFFTSRDTASTAEIPGGAGSRGGDAVAAEGIHALTPLREAATAGQAGEATRNRNSYTSRTDI
jgi:hypothetical protein